LAGRQVVAHDAYLANAVVQPVEGGALQLLEAPGNQSACSSQHPIEPVSETDVQTVGKQVAAAKFPRVANQFIERESDRRIEGSDNRAGARPDDDVDGNAVRDQLLKDPDVTCAPQTSAAEYHRDANWRIRIASIGEADSSQRLR
jgi:hypothetical protein